uniref:Uncharacterized protein n=1 Tax=Anopheles atroparvus TaxID=41427 RepID=A0AAG5CRN8_ANOAO
DNVTVGAGRQAGLQTLVQIERLHVEGDEATGSATERHLVVAVVPPVVDLRACDGVTEANHVIDLTPPVLAHPSATARVVRVESWRDQVLVCVLRRPSFGVGKCERAHDAHDAERMRQHERRGHLVVPRHLVRQDIGTTGTVSALVVVVVDEHQRQMGRQEAPARAPVA